MEQWMWIGSLQKINRNGIYTHEKMLTLTQNKKTRLKLLQWGTYPSNQISQKFYNCAGENR